MAEEAKEVREERVASARFRNPTRERGDMAASREEVFERVKEVLVEQLASTKTRSPRRASFQENLDADSLDSSS